MAIKAQTISLGNRQLRIQWQQTKEGWKINSLRFFINGQWQPVAHPSGEYTLLYTAEKPAGNAGITFKAINGKAWPDTAYKYQIKAWKQATSPVALNTAGEAFHFYPSGAKQVSPTEVVFTYTSPLATITATWQLDGQYDGDVIVHMQMQCKKDGYYSLSSPSAVTVNAQDMAWAVMPGYFQGKEMQKNMVLGYAYGQGVPEMPVLYRERCASSFCPIITTKENISFAVIPDPGLGRDPWENDHNTHQNWRLALSHKNRRSQLSPTVYYPVLGEPASLKKQGDNVSYGFRYSFNKGEWYHLLTHAVNDVYDFKKALALRKNTQSLTSRVEHMHHYLHDRKTSLWNIEQYKGLTIGGQSYLGGVVGSNHDAIKNADYGAMWMLANTSNDKYLKDSVLPFALNFKLAQQQTTPGFFQGAAIGQYYLSKSKTFTEEWGDFVEPISLTYYVMLDIGNILLFEPGNDTLKQRLALGASLLMKWQKPDGSWEVAYDRHTQQPLFTDIKDLRPTFYGLLVAYRILKDGKYLTAAKKGADWFIQNAVNRGHFIGVCGDARYAPDFATAQSAQALLDLYDLTHDKKYQDAAISTARMYLTSIYTQPVPSEKIKHVNGIAREDWQISQAGLSFEHGGILGSANGAGPIMLCSHAGMFVRMFQLTGDSLFIEMARAAAIGRDAFVDPETSVASYYWTTMNKGAGPYPHHAWWQIGWITDYLLSEAQLRSGNQVIFPRGFVTPKVGPHESYGFSPGKVYGNEAHLINGEGIVECSNPNMEYILARGTDAKSMFIILLNDTGAPLKAHVKLNRDKANIPVAGNAITDLAANRQLPAANELDVTLEGYGIKVLMIH
ncbi:MAG TPA: glycerophosphoryl diester phosphodiesterase [Chitinophaga sp.]|uniref:glycerophosphoryl diester phosphodiesterase n=1 Tax=Chitinophaga sp. TaxID=1869181 RepID=UPI002DB718F7|nr:glycerophosphoryl diester phosphodiesterase [Chitinophaga sp.]HEU4554594.1 glycerophosphoryl diester phosphodiesterase [Chitinophaga sp.]